MTDALSHEDMLAAMTLAALRNRQRALLDYEMSIIRIGEDSDAADRELSRVQRALSALSAEIRRRDA